MTRVVESTHNSKIAEALLTRQHLEKASAKAIDLVMDDSQGACTPADMWQVEKRISAHISHKRAKAYKALVEQHCSESEASQRKGWTRQWVLSDGGGRGGIPQIYE